MSGQELSGQELSGQVNGGLARQLDAITQSVAVIAFAGLVVMALLIFYDGSARYLNVPRISGFSDYGEIVYPIVIAACFPAGLLRQNNVSVRVLGKIAGPRVNAWLEAFAAIVTLVFFSVLAWQLVLLTIKYAEGGRTTRTIGIALAPWWWITSGIMLMCVPVQLYVAYAWLHAAVTGAVPDISQLREHELTELGEASDHTHAAELPRD